MGIFKKIIDTSKKAKNAAVNFVTEEVVVEDSNSEEPSKKKRKLKGWVKTTGKVAAVALTVVAAKKGYDTIKSKSGNSTYVPIRQEKHPSYSPSYKPQPKPQKQYPSPDFSVNVKDTSLDNLIKASSCIEGVLEGKGAEGRGLHEKLSCVEDVVSEESVKSMRFIATVRNKLVHEGPDTITPETKQEYLSACKKVLRDLNSYN